MLRFEGPRSHNHNKKYAGDQTSRFVRECTISIGERTTHRKSYLEERGSLGAMPSVLLKILVRSSSASRKRTSALSPSRLGHLRVLVPNRKGGIHFPGQWVHVNSSGPIPLPQVPTPCAPNKFAKFLPAAGMYRLSPSWEYIQF